MKIYFEDGFLRNIHAVNIDTCTVKFAIDAGRGATENLRDLEMFLNHQPDCVLYTNSIFAFSNEFAWNKTLQVPEIYIRAGEYMLWTRIDKLTTRQLKKGMNLAKMYMAGEFNTY